MPSSGRDLEAELAPLLGELDAVGEQAEEIRRGALKEAERRREAAAREAAVLHERARERADGERAGAALKQRSKGQRDGAEARLAAQRQAELIKVAGEERIATLLAEVIECVRRSGR